jgi:cellulose synthase/poly-beta-1,6-N-acetylglucosamine synthase-like glycosyltransferase
MLSEIIHIMEYTLYIYLSVSVGYIVLFSAASHFFKQKKYPATTVRQRFIILVPAYKEDAVIHACVTSVLRQTYPAELYDLIVISDHMRPETNASLRTAWIKGYVFCSKAASLAVEPLSMTIIS